MRFKVGDRVRIKNLDWYNENKTIHGDVWFDNAVFVGGQSLYCGCELTIRLVTNDSYYVIENDYYWTDEMLECKVEDEMPLDKAGQITDFEYEGLAYTLPEGYQFVDENGNVINATKIVLEKKKHYYPKTYKECCLILGIPVAPLNPLKITIKSSQYEKHLGSLIEDFIHLRTCRDAYWKIAGEGLGKPWKPDWLDDDTKKYVITSTKVFETFGGLGYINHILTFPTEEMRDAFYENFKELIEMCKELL